MITIEKLSKTFKNDKEEIQILKDINLNVPQGNITGIIGKSGAGKSTLLRCINLLEQPSSGHIKINGTDITKLTSKELRSARKDIGLIFQSYNLFNSRNVFDNVAFPLELIKCNKDEIKTKVLELLERTNLIQYKDAKITQLSGGQKQRVAIARALTTKPKVLLCDEITSAQDAQNTNETLDFLKQLNLEFNLSIILITHEIEVIKKIADNVAVLANGEIIEQGKVLDIFANPKAQITKDLIQSSMHVNLPQSLKDKINKTKFENSSLVLRLTFVGDAAQKPIIDSLCKIYSIHVNILLAHMETIQHTTLGMMVIAIDIKENELNAGITFLREKNINVEELGYVNTSTLSA